LRYTHHITNNVPHIVYMILKQYTHLIKSKAKTSKPILRKALFRLKSDR